MPHRARALTSTVMRNSEIKMRVLPVRGGVLSIEILSMAAKTAYASGERARLRGGAGGICWQRLACKCRAVM